MPKPKRRLSELKILRLRLSNEKFKILAYLVNRCMLEVGKEESSEGFRRIFLKNSILSIKWGEAVCLIPSTD